MIVIPAGYTPEDWAAFGPGIMARLKAELADLDLIELDDDQLVPDTTDPLPDEEPVKTDAVPDE